MTMTSGDARAGRFVHAAFFYDTASRYTDVIVPFLQEGLAAGEPALVAVPAPNLELLRPALAGTSGQVSFQDMLVLGRNPARIIPFIRRFTAAHPGPTRFVGEPIWAGRTSAEMLEATRHEALINAAFEGAVTTVLCPYGTAALGGDVLADAHRTHPHILDGGDLTASPRYAGADLAAAISGQPLAGPPRQADTHAFTAADMPRLRQLVTSRAAAAGLSGTRAEDLTLAVHEAASNTIRYAGGSGTLRIWPAQTGLICEISDSGHITDPLAGRRPPAPGGGGYGLQVINQVCDLVELRTGEQGTVIRLHMNRV